MNHQLGFFFFRFTEIILGKLPFAMLYGLSNGLAYIVQYVIKYRKDVIETNLEMSFPDKSTNELKSIKSSFYTNLMDITIESFIGTSINTKVLKKRYVFNNPELLHEYHRLNRDVIIVGSHYTNWEWGAYALGPIFDQHIIALYKPLKNPILDQHVKSTRASKGLELAPISKTRYIFKSDENNRPRLFVFLSDQSPSNIKEAIWVDFLNQKTACLHGVEMYAKQYDLPVVFSDIRRVKRGHYEVDFIAITDCPNQTKRGEITEAYMSQLERRIKKEPQNWLWSHRRWKHEYIKTNKL